MHICCGGSTLVFKLLYFYENGQSIKIYVLGRKLEIGKLPVKESCWQTNHLNCSMRAEKGSRKQHVCPNVMTFYSLQRYCLPSKTQNWHPCQMDNRNQL